MTGLGEEMILLISLQITCLERGFCGQYNEITGNNKKFK